MVQFNLDRSISRIPLTTFVVNKVQVQMENAKLASASSISLVPTEIIIDFTLGGTAHQLSFRSPAGVNYANLIAQIPELVKSRIDANGNII